MASSAPICQITGSICGVDGSPKPGIQVRVTIRSTEADKGGQVFSGAGVTSDEVSAITIDDGTFTLTVLQGAVVQIEIPDINLKKLVTIPAAATVDFSTII